MSMNLHQALLRISHAVLTSSSVWLSFAHFRDMETEVYVGSVVSPRLYRYYMSDLEMESRWPDFTGRAVTVVLPAFLQVRKDHVQQEVV